MTEEAQDQAVEQSEPSIEDRIAGKFDQPAPVEADTPDEPVESDEGTPEPEFVEIEYDGEKFQIPRKLEKAIMQERDYTQKSQALAEQRRQIEFAQKAIETARIEAEFQEAARGELQQLNLLDSYLQQMRAVNVNDLPMEDGFRHWTQMQQLKEQKEALEHSLKAKRDDYSRRAEAQVESLRAEAKALLSKQVPNLTDETIAQMEAHAKSFGYTDHDIAMFRTDPRASAVLIKAMRYDQLQANKSAAVQKATPVIKPGSSNPMPQAVKDKLALRKALQKSGDSQAKARLIQQALESRF